MFIPAIGRSRRYPATYPVKMRVTWTCLVTWIFAGLSPYLSCALAESAENASLPHIHQHNGHMTSPNSSNIIREEGMYFLELLFTEYGTGSTMEVSKLEKLLDNVGYISPDYLDHGHHEDHGQEGEHSDHEDHGQEGEHSDHEDHGQEGEHSDHEDHGQEGEHSDHEDHGQDGEHSDHEESPFDLDDHDIHEEDHQGEDQSNEDHNGEDQNNEDHSKHEEHEENISNEDHFKHEEEHGKELHTKHEEINRNENSTKHEEDHSNGDHTKDEGDHGDHDDPEPPSVNEEEHSDHEEDHSENESNGKDKDVHVDQRGNITEHEQNQKGKPSDGQTRHQKQNEGERRRNRKRKGKKKNHSKKHSNTEDEHNRKVRKHQKHEQKEILHEGHKHSIEGDDNNGNLSKKGHELVDKGHKGKSREHGGNLHKDPSVKRRVNSSDEHTDAEKQGKGRINKNPSENGRIEHRREDRYNKQSMDSEKHGLDSDNDQLENNHESVHIKKQESKKDRKHKNKKRRKGKKKGRKQKQKQKSPSRDKRSAGHAIFHKHDVHAECMSIRELTEIFHFDKKTRISQKDFLYMSPAIIYQLDQPHCRRSRKSHAHEQKVAPKDISGRVWGYSSAAVLVISLVGLLGVAVIPIMQKVFYNQLLQFLVAMAVGALAGDAMLHLLPHAIAGDESPDPGDGHDHSSAVWKGLSGLAGIYFFFIIQRILTIVSGVRSKRRGDKKSRVLESDIDRVVKKDVHAPMGISVPNRDIEQLQPLKVKEVEGEYSEGHSHGGHGHSHHDGSIPTSVSAVAWMVILGDGVHNFSDGLAIGAAFASSITGGFSTAIAVFCHELPHEIGDFAVLLKSGMSVKKAVLYNVVSSALCFLGMLIGVALGNIHEASTWIFSGVAGMFIYISLVTMIPELTSVNSNKPVRDLFLQCCGLCVGSGIMLAIAIYESELKTILD